MTDKEKFNGKCPYTNKLCEDWDCLNCKVEEEEREYMKETKRTKIEYTSTGEITAEIKINGEKAEMVKSFTFYHDTEGLPTAIIEFLDPEVYITSLDSMLIREKGR